MDYPDFPVMSEEEVSKMINGNPDMEVEGYEEREQGEIGVDHYDWKHSILMGLVSGLLWAVAAGGLIGGTALLIVGLIDHSGLSIFGGTLFLIIGVTVGVAAKIFYDKVRYGEV